MVLMQYGLCLYCYYSIFVSEKQRWSVMTFTLLCFKLLKDAWLLHMDSPAWRWQQLQVGNEDHGAPELWCHPACKVGVLFRRAVGCSLGDDPIRFTD